MRQQDALRINDGDMLFDAVCAWSGRGLFPSAWTGMGVHDNLTQMASAFALPGIRVEAKRARPFQYTPGRRTP